MSKANFGLTAFSFVALSGVALAQGVDGTALPVELGKFRTEFEGGFIYPQFAQFKFGDVRDTFPSLGGTVIRNAFDDRPYAISYYAGAREGFRLPCTLKDGPLEFNLRFGIYDAKHHSRFSENDETPEVYVPYIDGVVRPDLNGGAVVGLFANSLQKLHRKLFSYEIEGGLRACYSPNNWKLMPGIYFTYQRMQQKDYLNTSVISDPTSMTLSAHINSNQYDAGLNFRFSSPLRTFSWLGGFSVGAEFSDARYHGRQTFAGSVFDLPEEQLAVRHNDNHHWGVSTALETGLGILCNRKVSLSILGNARYISNFPYVKYPVPIIDTNTVTGPAKLKFQGQWSFGGDLNISIIF